MELSFEPVAPPLRMDETGICRVSGTRVTLQTILEFHRMGQTPEQIHEGFPTVPLADVYAAIAYYHGHREAVDEYLAETEAAAQRIQHEIESDPGYREHVEAVMDRIRQRLAS